MRKSPRSDTTKPRVRNSPTLDEILASSSSDKTIRIWNLTTNTCKFILTGHTKGVTGLKQITSSILASGSYDYTIKLWNTTSGQLIRTLSNHTGAIQWSVDLLNSKNWLSVKAVSSKIEYITGFIFITLYLKNSFPNNFRSSQFFSV